MVDLAGSSVIVVVLVLAYANYPNWTQSVGRSSSPPVKLEKPLGLTSPNGLLSQPWFRSTEQRCLLVTAELLNSSG